MEDKIRGLRCGLPSLGINGLLEYMSRMNAVFWVCNCDKIHRRDQMLPESAVDFFVTAEGLRELARDTIWELVLQLYPQRAEPENIETYEDFERSNCLCCLIYYDCGWLDLYVKDGTLFREVEKLLTSLEAADLHRLTRENNGRTVLHL